MGTWGGRGHIKEITSDTLIELRSKKVANIVDNDQPALPSMAASAHGFG